MNPAVSCACKNGSFNPNRVLSLTLTFWFEVPRSFNSVLLHQFVCHVHLLLYFLDSDGSFAPARRCSLSSSKSHIHIWFGQFVCFQNKDNLIKQGVSEYRSHSSTSSIKEPSVEIKATLLKSRRKLTLWLVFHNMTVRVIIYIQKNNTTSNFFRI